MARSKRRQTYRFSEMKIPTGSKLTSIPSGEETTVIGDRKVLFRGREMGLTTASGEVRKRGKSHSDWAFEGKRFEDIYNETYGNLE